DVARDHDSFRKALGTRRADVVVTDHLEDGRTRVTGEQADVEGCEHECGKHEVVQRLDVDAPLAREQCVDRVQAGLARRRGYPRVESFCSGKPAELEEAEI